MDADPHDEFGFPLSLSEQFRGRTMRITNIRPQSSATQDEDWYEIQVPAKPLSDRDREAERLRPFVKPGQELVYNEELRSWRIEEQVPRHRNESTALGKDREQANSGRDGNRRSARVEEVISLGARSQPAWKERAGKAVAPAGTQALPVDTTTACIGRLPGEAFWAWSHRMSQGE